MATLQPAKMVRPGESLVRYDNPALISRTDGTTKGQSKAPGKDQRAGAKKLPPVDDKGKPKTPTQTEDILNSILPPRYAVIIIVDG